MRGEGFVRGCRSRAARNGYPRAIFRVISTDLRETLSYKDTNINDEKECNLLISRIKILYLLLDWMP